MTDGAATQCTASLFKGSDFQLALEILVQTATSVSVVDHTTNTHGEQQHKLLLMSAVLVLHSRGSFTAARLTDTTNHWTTAQC